MLNDQESQVYEVLESLKIPFARHEHPPVFTVEQANQYWADIRAAHCKS